MWGSGAYFERIIFVFEPQELYFANVTQGSLTIPRADIIPATDPKLVDHNPSFFVKSASKLLRAAGGGGDPPSNRPNRNFFAQEVLWRSCEC